MILAELRRRDVDLFLLTYASFPLPGRGPLHQEAADASDVLRRFGSANGVRVIDVHDRFLALLPPGTPRAKYFWREKDGHPNPAGYAEVARMVADRLLPALDPGSSAVPEPAADLLNLAAVVAVASLARKRLPNRRHQHPKTYDDAPTTYTNPTT